MGRDGTRICIVVRVSALSLSAAGVCPSVSVCVYLSLSVSMLAYVCLHRDTTRYCIMMHYTVLHAYPQSRKEAKET